MTPAASITTGGHGPNEVGTPTPTLSSPATPAIRGFTATNRWPPRSASSWPGIHGSTGDDEPLHPGDQDRAARRPALDRPRCWHRLGNRPRTQWQHGRHPSRNHHRPSQCAPTVLELHPTIRTPHQRRHPPRRPLLPTRPQGPTLGRPTILGSHVGPQCATVARTNHVGSSPPVRLAPLATTLDLRERRATKAKPYKYRSEPPAIEPGAHCVLTAAKNATPRRRRRASTGGINTT